MKFITNYFSEVRQELAKVSWPKRDIVIGHTTSVFISIAVAIFILSGIDFIFSKIANIMFIGGK
jgi:preprotein translocase SecE subunit